MRIPTCHCRCSKWPPSAATQAVKCLVKFATALFMCSWGSSSKMVCKAKLINFLGLHRDFMVLLQHGALHVLVQWVLEITDSSRWTQDSLHAASPAWCAPCELRHRLDVRWSLDCLCGCQWWSLRASASSLYPHLSTKKRLFSEPHTFYI